MDAVRSYYSAYSSWSVVTLSFCEENQSYSKFFSINKCDTETELTDSLKRPARNLFSYFLYPALSEQMVQKKVEQWALHQISTKEKVSLYPQYQNNSSNNAQIQTEI